MALAQGSAMATDGAASRTADGNAAPEVTSGSHARGRCHGATAMTSRAMMALDSAAGCGRLAAGRGCSARSGVKAAVAPSPWRVRARAATWGCVGGGESTSEPKRRRAEPEAQVPAGRGQVVSTLYTHIQWRRDARAAASVARSGTGSGCGRRRRGGPRAERGRSSTHTSVGVST